MMMNLMTILVKKVFISSKPTFVYLLCPPLCGPFSIQESAAGGLSYKAKKDSLAAALHPFPYLIPFPEISSLIPEVHLLLPSNMLRLKHRISAPHNSPDTEAPVSYHFHAFIIKHAQSFFAKICSFI